jgi:serine protease Do
VVKPVVDQIIQYGKAKRGWLGVRVQSVQDDMVEALGLKSAKGALIASVTPKSPAAEAGIQARDVITEFDGKEVTDNGRLPRLVASTEIDKPVTVKLFRDGKELTKQVKIAEMPADVETADADQRSGKEKEPPKAGESIDSLGVGVAALTPELRRQYQIGDNVTGLVVTNVKANSPADEKGLQTGDVLVEVNQQEVKNAKDLQARLDQAKQQGKKAVLVLRERRGEQGFVALPLTGKSKS